MNQISDSFNRLMKEISERRSVRRYTDAPVDDQLLNRLLEVAGHTQTMGNLQLYSVVVTRSEEKKRQLAPAHGLQTTGKHQGIRRYIAQAARLGSTLILQGIVGSTANHRRRHQSRNYSLLHPYSPLR